MIDDAKRKGLWVMAEDIPAGSTVKGPGFTRISPDSAAKSGVMISLAAPFTQGEPKPPEGNFTFSPEELDNIIVEWEELRSDLESDERAAIRMARVLPPGEDFASSEFANSANPSGKFFYDALQKMIDYVNRYIEALKDARQQMSTQDEQANSDIAKAGEIES